MHVRHAFLFLQEAFCNGQAWYDITGVPCQDEPGVSDGSVLVKVMWPEGVPEVYAKSCLRPHPPLLSPGWERLLQPQDHVEYYHEDHGWYAVIVTRPFTKKRRNMNMDVKYLLTGKMYTVHHEEIIEYDQQRRRPRLRPLWRMDSSGWVCTFDKVERTSEEWNYILKDVETYLTDVDEEALARSFQKGDTVEAMSMQPGKDCWCRAIIAEKPKMHTTNGELKVWCKVRWEDSKSCEIENLRLTHVRPLPPLPPFDWLKQLQLGDECDMEYDGGWWKVELVDQNKSSLVVRSKRYDKRHHLAEDEIARRTRPNYKWHGPTKGFTALLRCRSSYAVRSQPQASEHCRELRDRGLNSTSAALTILSHQVL